MDIIKKRLHILALAISLEDEETIAIQYTILLTQTDDKKVQNILLLLEKQDYKNANKYIEYYLSTPREDTYLDTINTPSEEKNDIDFNLHEIIPKDDFFDTLDILHTDNNENNNFTDHSDELDKKFKHLQQMYHATDSSYNNSQKVEKWMNILRNDSYTEAEISTLLQESQSLEEINKSEAGHLLLLAATTSSQYAQFVLARALYKGNLLIRDLDASFKIMSQLAYKEKYPEAICDLAQFYENGISVDIDTLQAETLYKEAFDLGIQRAQKHYARLQKESEGFFSFFKSS